MNKSDMLRLLNTPGTIEAKFKQGFETFDVAIKVVESTKGRVAYLELIPLLPIRKFYLDYYRQHISVIKNSAGQYTGFEIWQLSAAGYMKLFYPFGKVKFICHYPEKFYNPQPLNTND